MKRIIATILALLLLAGALSGCDSKKPVEANTPLAEAYNAVLAAKRTIKGFNEVCVHYNAVDDSLSLYAPEMKEGVVTQPALWRESLSRMNNVENLILPCTRVGAEGPSFVYLNEITGGEAMFPQYKTVTADLRHGYSSLEGIELFSGIERLRLTVSGVTGTKDEVDTDALYDMPSLKAVEVAFGVGSTSTAKLAYALRAQGFNVEGVSQNPRDDLQVDSTRREYDEFVALEQAKVAFESGEGTFDERYDSLIKLIAAGWSDELAKKALDFLAYFYSLAQTPEFPEHVARLAYKEPATGVSKYELMLGYIASLVDDSAEQLAKALPQGGDWCGAKMAAEGDADALFTLVSRSLDGGTISTDAAYEVMLNSAKGEDARFEGLLGYSYYIDAMLYAMSLWESKYDAPVMKNYTLEHYPLICDGFDSSNPPFVPDDGKNNVASGGRKALFAYIMPDSTEPVLTAAANMQIGNDEGGLYRAIPKAQTPKSLAEAEILIIAHNSYVHAFDYTDGTPGYACISEVYAYDMATHECINYLGAASNDSPATTIVSLKAERVNAGMATMDICNIISEWLTDGADAE